MVDLETWGASTNQGQDPLGCSVKVAPKMFLSTKSSGTPCKRSHPLNWATVEGRGYEESQVVEIAAGQRDRGRQQQLVWGLSSIRVLQPGRGRFKLLLDSSRELWELIRDVAGQ